MIKMLTKEQIEKIKTFSYARQRNLRVNAREFTDFFNEVMGTNVRITTCSTCIRRRIQELENRLKQFEEQNKVEEQEQPVETESDVEQTQEEVVKEKEDVVEEQSEEIKEENKKKPGRPKKEEQKDDGHNKEVKEQVETAVEEGSTD